MLTNFQEQQLAFTNREATTMNLMQAQEGKEYIIRGIETDDEDLNAFLFSLGCYSGEPITVIARKKRNCVGNHRLYAVSGIPSASV